MYKLLWERCLPDITPQKIIFGGVRGGNSSLLYQHQPGHVYAAPSTVFSVFSVSLCFLLWFLYCPSLLLLSPVFSSGFRLLSATEHGGEAAGPVDAEWALLAQGPACC